MEGGLLQEFNFRHVMLTLLLDIQLQMLMVNNCTSSLALRETGFGAMISYLCWLNLVLVRSLLSLAQVVFTPCDYCDLPFSPFSHYLRRFPEDLSL